MADRIAKAQIEKLRGMVREEFKDMGLGHGMDHLERVERLALEFLSDNGDRSVTRAIALLHDADDYKLVKPGTDCEALPNARRLLKACGIQGEAYWHILSDLSKFGYSKRLQGLAPEYPEGQAVSDADMCDIMGASGLSRMGEYNAQTGTPMFDPGDHPNQDLNFDTYRNCRHESMVRHMFDKVLRLPECMLTEKGRIEAYLRKDFNIVFLRAVFRENQADDWMRYLDAFLAGDMAPKGIFKY